MLADMVDALGVSDIFASGLGDVEDVGGGCVRFTFFAIQHIGDREEKIVVCRLIMPVKAAHRGIRMSDEALGLDPAVMRN